MTAKEFFENIYYSIGEVVFINRAHFITLLFTAGAGNGVPYFTVSETAGYGPSCYQYKIFNGSRPLSSNIKRSCLNDGSEQGLVNFFCKYITDGNIKNVKKRFGVSKINCSKEELAKALSSQFMLFMRGENNVISNIVHDELLSYKNGPQSLYETGKNELEPLFTFSKLESEKLKNKLVDYDPLLQTALLYKKDPIKVDVFLEKFICSSDIAILLIGEGGSGKTEILRHIWRKTIGEYRQRGCLSIMIDIKICSRTINGILSYIKKASSLLDSDVDSWEQLSNYLRLNVERKSLSTIDFESAEADMGYNKKYYLLILADGFNEAGGDAKQCFINELDEIRRVNDPNIKLIVSSRYTPSSMLNFDDEVSVLELESEIRREYLTIQGIEGSSLENGLKIAVTPFLITLYSKNCNLANTLIMRRLEAKDKLTNSTDILWNYSRSLFIKFAGNHDAGKIQNEYILLFHILPYIAYRLEKEQEFLFDIQWLRIILSNFCEEFEDSVEDSKVINTKYCEAFSSVFIIEDWNCKFIIEDVNKILHFLCNDVTILKKDDKLYSFSHHIFRDFYAALYEYNIADYLLTANCSLKGFTQPVLHNSIRKYYHNLFSKKSLFLDYEKYKNNLKNNKNSFIKLCEIISDEYYFLDNKEFEENELDIKSNKRIHHRDNALKYTEEAAKENGIWALWNAAFMYKEKITGNSKNDFKNFENAYKYTRLAMQNEYYAGYDIMAQFYIYDKFYKYLSYYEEINEDERYKKAVEYLKIAENFEYSFAFNKHGILYETGKLKSENNIQSAFELFDNSAKKGDYWAKSRVSQYIRLFWSKIDIYKDLTEKQALIKSYEYLENIYNKVFVSTDDMYYEQGYESVLINIANAKCMPLDLVFNLDAHNFYRKAYYTLRNKPLNDLKIYSAMMLLISSKVLQEEVLDLIEDVDIVIKSIVKKYNNLEIKTENFFVECCLKEQKQYYEQFKKIFSKEVFKILTKDFSIILLENHNYKACEYVKNIFKLEDYENMLYNFERSIIDSSKRQDIYNDIFEESNIEANIKHLVDKTKVTPGIALVYGTKDYAECIFYGNQQEYIDDKKIIYEKKEKITKGTIFDLASITKIFTSVSIMILVEKKLLNLEDYVGIYDERFIHIKDIKISDILAFRVSLRTDERIEYAENREEVEKLIFTIQETKYNEKNPYSDMNAIVLSFIIEKITNQSFISFINDNIIKVCNMENTGDRVPQSKLLNAASNNYEACEQNGEISLNMRIKKGIIHDPKAYKFYETGIGMRGHAGLFTTIEDMCRFSRALICGKVISVESVEEIGINRTGFLCSDGTYTKFLGYQCYSKHPLLESSEVSHMISGCAIGAGGYTGMQLTIDIRNKIFSFIASNRCHFRLTKSDINLQYPKDYQGRTIYCSNNFAWDRDKLLRELNEISLKYRFIEENYLESNLVSKLRLRKLK